MREYYLLRGEMIGPATGVHAVRRAPGLCGPVSAGVRRQVCAVRGLHTRTVLVRLFQRATYAG